MRCHWQRSRRHYSKQLVTLNGRLAACWWVCDMHSTLTSPRPLIAHLPALQTDSKAHARWHISRLCWMSAWDVTFAKTSLDNNWLPLDTQVLEKLPAPFVVITWPPPGVVMTCLSSTHGKLVQGLTRKSPVQLDYYQSNTTRMIWSVNLSSKCYS